MKKLTILLALLCALLASCAEQTAQPSAPDTESREAVSVTESSLPQASQPQASASQSESSGPEESAPEESAPEELQPSATYSDMEVLRTFEDGLMVLEDPYAPADQKHVLVQKNGGTYVELLRDSNLRTGYVAISPDGETVAFNNFEREGETETYLYDLSENRKRKLYLCDPEEDKTVSFLGWLHNQKLLFVVQLDHGTVVQGGELWCFDIETGKIQPVFYTADPRLQITSFVVGKKGGSLVETVDLQAVFFDKHYNTYEEMSFSFSQSLLTNDLAKQRVTTLSPDTVHFRSATAEELSHDFQNATPGASVTNKYVMFFDRAGFPVTFYTFRGVKEDAEKGWLYEYTETLEVISDGYNSPFYIEGSASYSAAETWGVSFCGRYYARVQNLQNGEEWFEDITDQVLGYALPEDLSQLFKNYPATYYDDYAVLVHHSASVFYVFDWEQYFIVDKPITLDVTGDIALGFVADNTGLEDYYYKPMMYRFEKGKAEPTKTVIDVPAVHEAYYSYHPVTEKTGYLMVFGIRDNGSGTEYLEQVLKTTDGGVNWKLVEKSGFPTGGTSHDSVYYSTFLTEDFGVIAFLCNFDTDLARHVYYTNDGGKTWQRMTGLNNLPRDPDEEWDLENITLENGVYTITIRTQSYNQCLCFTSTDLENWKPVPQVLFSFATDEQIADTENYTHVYDPKAKNPTYHLLMEVTAPIKDLCFVEIDESEYRQLGETLYEIGDCTPGTPFILHTYINDIHINRGFSYTDENGNTRYLAFSESMVDGTLSFGEITFD